MAKSLPNDGSNNNSECQNADSVTQQIADIVIKSDVIQSEFGDLRLFYQHEDMRGDLNLRPEWASCIERRRERDFNDDNLFAWPREEEEAKEWVIYSLENWGCPFAWLLDDWVAP